MTGNTESSEAIRDTASLGYDGWREALEAGTLVGVRCRACGHVSATPKRACPDCRTRDLDAVELPDRGTVHSETTINVAPEGFEGPYQVAVVILGEARLLVRIDGSVEIGETVEFSGTVEESGDPGPVFEPVG